MKKKIDIIFFFLLTMLCLSCERESGFEVPEPQLKVIEADVIFETLGGNGFIELMAPGPVTAQSNAEWCSVSVSGSTVNLVVEPNTSMGGRTATITIRSNGETIAVTAVQTASIMWLKDFKTSSLALMSEGGTIATAVKSSYPIKVDSKPDWITYKFENDSLYLTAEPSIPRKGSITFSSEGRTITYEILQFSYAGLLGEWKLDYTNPSQSNQAETTTITFEEKTKNESFWLKGLIITGANEAEIHVDFNPNSYDLSITAGQFMMQATDGRYVYLCLRTDSGSYNWGATLVGVLDIADDGTVTYSFVHPNNYNGIGFYLFTGEGPTGATGSSYRRLMNLVMTKL
jgi:hypothetical protein